MLALMTGNLVYLISTKGAQRVWPASTRCLLLHGTLYYLRFFGGAGCHALEFLFTLWALIAFFTLLNLIRCFVFNCYTLFWYFQALSRFMFSCLEVTVIG
jgi:hypothetical protein